MLERAIAQSVSENYAVVNDTSAVCAFCIPLFLSGIVSLGGSVGQQQVRTDYERPTSDSMAFFMAFKVSCVSRAIFLFMMKLRNHTFSDELE